MKAAPSRKCNILDVGDEKIDMTKLELKEFKNGENTYIFNFVGNSSKCSGYICRNGDYLLGFIEECPVVTIEDDRVIMNYSTQKDCLLRNAGKLFFYQFIYIFFFKKPILATLHAFHDHVSILYRV